VAAKILGIVIGKAIFERIPLKCFLNYTILRQICSQPIQMNDIFTYDSDVSIVLPSFTEAGSLWSKTTSQPPSNKTFVCMNSMSMEPR